jgi:hypothetical protein
MGGHLNVLEQGLVVENVNRPLTGCQGGSTSWVGDRRRVVRIGMIPQLQDPPHALVQQSPVVVLRWHLRRRRRRVGRYGQCVPLCRN